MIFTRRFVLPTAKPCRHERKRPCSSAPCKDLSIAGKAQSLFSGAGGQLQEAGGAISGGRSGAIDNAAKTLPICTC
ncbi:hypothetical protein MPL1032_190315 [Mesorhizobium plurifarium]|uniref:Uncharacterized protein n=1 Tax=Mesorhizobium plurifarium TaxID=69974 RepID=A0A0K2VV85_MESPL|nr:hypothetical protein MPL1032_190315 [Mesorhizobium plurifarium]